tara:strand:- start:148 stop:432 length:285 start_codon:yes stop_codon:yes gene_type:complete
MKTINFKGKGEHSVNELELIVEQQAKELHLIRSGQEQLILTNVVNCVYVVTERDNYGEKLFIGVFSNKEKAIGYLAEGGLKESNIDEINEIELD